VRSDILPLDVLVTGVPKSGTSMLCNLLCDPLNRRICLYEPRIAQNPSPSTARGRQTLTHLANHGVHSYRRSDFDHLAIKEVFRGDAAQGHALAERTLLIVRNPRHLGMSMLDQIRNRNPEAKALGRIKWAGRMADFSVEIADDPQTIVTRYEDFVRSTEEQERVQKLLEWSFNYSNLMANLKEQGRLGEIERHPKGIDDASIRLRNASDDPDYLEIASLWEERMVPYARKFGYV
jgi:hypothetical protein